MSKDKDKLDLKAGNITITTDVVSREQIEEITKALKGMPPVPRVVEVHGCGDCRFAEWSTEVSCNHPDATGYPRKREQAGREGVPRWCPLRDRPVILRLGPEHREAVAQAKRVEEAG